MELSLDRRPVIVAVAGPNGAGKSTFFHAHLEQAGLRFLNADVLARELHAGPYEAARIADSIRKELVRQRESFVFETVFSDPVGDKISFLKDAEALGYTVVVCFIGISDSTISEERISMRVSQGGHDVPKEKLEARYPRTMANLRSALHEMPHVWVFDNDNLLHPFRLVAVYQAGRQIDLALPVPNWLKPALP